MNEQLKNRIYDRFYWELRERITFDEHFHIDFEIKENNSVFEFVSTLYAEQGEPYGVFDYDMPVEYSSPCISCIFSNLVEITPEGTVVYHTTESEIIVYDAIKNYRV